MDDGFASAKRIVRRAVESTLDRRLVDNRFRPILVEAMVAEALEPDWEWTAGDWAGWDFTHVATKARLEVKQTAALQSWAKLTDKPSAPRFDIAARQGHYEGNVHVPNTSGARFAQIYVFARHEETGDKADHREPSQWRFLAIAAAHLPPPPAKSILWQKLLDLKRGEPVPLQELAAVVEALRRDLEPEATMLQAPMLERWVQDEENGGLPIEVIVPAPDKVK